MTNLTIIFIILDILYIFCVKGIINDLIIIIFHTPCNDDKTFDKLNKIVDITK